MSSTTTTAAGAMDLNSEDVSLVSLKSLVLSKNVGTKKEHSYDTIMAHGRQSEVLLIAEPSSSKIHSVRRNELVQYWRMEKSTELSVNDQRLHEEHILNHVVCLDSSLVVTVSGASFSIWKTEDICHATNMEVLKLLWKRGGNHTTEICKIIPSPSSCQFLLVTQKDQTEFRCTRCCLNIKRGKLYGVDETELCSSFEIFSVAYVSKLYGRILAGITDGVLLFDNEFCVQTFRKPHEEKEQEVVINLIQELHMGSYLLTLRKAAGLDKSVSYAILTLTEHIESRVPDYDRSTFSHSWSDISLLPCVPKSSILSCKALPVQTGLISLVWHNKMKSIGILATTPTGTSLVHYQKVLQYSPQDALLILKANIPVLLLTTLDKIGCQYLECFMVRDRNALKTQAIKVNHEIGKLSCEIQINKAIMQKKVHELESSNFDNQRETQPELAKHKDEQEVKFEQQLDTQRQDLDKQRLELDEQRQELVEHKEKFKELDEGQKELKQIIKDLQSKIAQLENAKAMAENPCPECNR